MERRIYTHSYHVTSKMLPITVCCSHCSAAWELRSMLCLPWSSLVPHTIHKSQDRHLAKVWFDVPFHTMSRQFLHLRAPTSALRQCCTSRPGCLVSCHFHAWPCARIQR